MPVIPLPVRADGVHIMAAAIAWGVVLVFAAVDTTAAREGEFSVDRHVAGAVGVQ